MGCMELATNALFEKSAYEPGLARNGPGRIQRDKERKKTSRMATDMYIYTNKCDKVIAYIMRNELDEQKNQQSICPEFTM